MRKFKRISFDDLQERDIVAIPTTNEDGQHQYCLGIISRVRFSTDKTERKDMEFVPLGETSRLTHEYNAETYEIDDPDTLKLTGMDTNHTAICVSVRFKPDEIDQDDIWFLGYLNYEFDDIEEALIDASEIDPNLLKLDPSHLKKLKLPDVTVEEYIERGPKERTTRSMAEQHSVSSDGSSHGALDIFGDDPTGNSGLILDLPENRNS